MNLSLQIPHFVKKTVWAMQKNISMPKSMREKKSMPKSMREKMETKDSPYFQNSKAKEREA
jgi:hypothetical protein